MVCYVLLAIVLIAIGAQYLKHHLRENYLSEIAHGVLRQEDFEKSLRKSVRGFCIICGLSLAALGIILLMAMLQQ